ncbi:MAG: DUF3365 domain-containing protein [Candidatus Marinimicrobia bacterium]|nr:DUF3365 domain-containing protein [Candidatus Neomarinimicrobiota bacterium]MCF7829526.1 DUF3365 domain-containing protein [Candidatus Neomarinimicrobiota bacterium]MCF7880076.1 DUF3365 domain-containing protein [Candidatus Neomarinimicrobiota bacterium]
MKSVHVIIILTILLIGCQSNQPDISQPDPDETVIIDSLGSRAATMLLSNLQPALLNAISEGGPVNGINVCSDTAQALTHMISQKLGDGIYVKRTTTRLRNPANAPDKFENLALKHFHEAATHTGELPSNYMQKIDSGESVFYRYYKPMQVGGLCLNCHGQPENISDPVKNILKKHYPGDNATGYNAGDFRGVVSVTIERNLN